MATPQHNPYHHSAPEANSGKKKWIFIALAVLVVFAIGLAASGGEKDSTASSFKASPTTQNEFVEATESESVEATEPSEGYSDIERIREIEEAFAEPAPAAEDSPSSESKLPLDFHSALSQAKTYSDLMHMSKQGIYDQLTSEYGGQFAPDAAQYAVDNLAADYNYNALEKARNYMDMMPMSMNELYDQLVSEYGEQFTPEEAQYAIDNLDS